MERTRIVGELSYNPDNIIGSGGFGNVVFHGLYRNSLPVAVKRVQRPYSEYQTLHQQLLQLFRDTNQPNILRFIHSEMDDDFTFIATELCEGTLQHYIKEEYKGPRFSDEREMLHQLTKAVVYLHGRGIVHRDIKPTKILIYLAGADRSIPQIKLNVSSIAKTLKAGREDFTNTNSANPSGTMGWMAPEMYYSERVDSKVDIWALGCVFAYSLTGGKHPFGKDVIERIDRTRKGSNMLLTIKDLKRPYCDEHSTFELIESMLKAGSSNRPSAERVYNHFFFEVLNVVVETVQESIHVLRNEKMGEYLSYDRYKGLGRGGFASVFQGIWKNPSADPLTGEILNERNVAVKRIQKGFNKPFSFQKEVEVMLKVSGNHPNILKCFTTHSNEDFLFIVTELCNGTLKEWMEGKYKGPPIGDERNILFQVTNGLAYLHDKGIVHRDIKPSNILISIPEVEGAEPLMKLADFGISKILTKENGFINTNVDNPSGSLGYTAPELYQSQRFSFKIDIYSLGVVFGQILSKERKNPFEIKLSSEGSTMVLKQEDIIEPYSNDCLVIELIKSMGSGISEDRPTAQTVLSNPFFHPMNVNM